MTSEDKSLTGKIVSVAAVGAGIALIEAELIPGLLIGAAALLVPDLLPRIGRAVRPAVKGVVRAGYTVGEKARETVAEAREEMGDIIAEARAEADGAPAAEPVQAAANPDSEAPAEEAGPAPRRRHKPVA